MAALTPETRSKKVRHIAKIRGFKPNDPNSDNPPWISLHHHTSDRVLLSFRDHHSNRDVYEVDGCYGQNEDNVAIYSREIKSLLPSVYDGQKLTVIGFGARGSGKTYTIHGNESEQGLAALAADEILSGADEKGMSIFISSFEVFNEHIYDLLDPKHPEIQVLEDAQGKIKLKGLSECILKSVSEFRKLCSIGCSASRRSHKGLILKFSPKNGTLSSKIAGKMTFVDLAGYEDARRRSCEGVDLIENSRINKSLYSLLNVIHATNANEPRVPFRESKLTRMLQDSFGAKNHVLLLNCLNPFFCQDTVFTLRLASRSCQGVNRMNANSAQKSKYLGKPAVSSVIKGEVSVGSSAKKQARSCITVRNKSRIAKESRRLDDRGKDDSALKQIKSPSVSTMQSNFLSEINSEIVLPLPEEEKSMSEVCDATEAKDEDTSVLYALEDTKPEEERSMSDDCVVTAAKDEDTTVLNALDDTKPKDEKKVEYQRTGIQNLENTPNVDGITKALTLLGEGDKNEKENDSICINGEESPPLSSRLRELSNNLRNLYNGTPIQIQLPPEANSSYGGNLTCVKVLEPKTPAQDKLNLASFNSPWEKFNTRSSGLKHSLADEYLKFINSASKEELKGLPGIGEKRAAYILELREESPEPFKSLEDLKDIGLSEKQVKGMMKKVAGDLFT